VVPEQRLPQALVPAQRARQRTTLEEGGCHRVGEPLGALERPSATDPRGRIGRQRRVPHQRDPGHGGRGATHQWVVVRAHDLGDALCVGQVRPVRQGLERVEERRLEIQPEPMQIGLDGHDGEDRDAVVVR
jgi:hypothetical protein